MKTFRLYKQHLQSGKCVSESSKEQDSTNARHIEGVMNTGKGSAAVFLIT